MMGVVKLGTRLTAVLLFAVTPVILGYTWWSVQRSTNGHITDLKGELRTAWSRTGAGDGKRFKGETNGHRSMMSWIE